MEPCSECGKLLRVFDRYRIADKVVVCVTCLDRMRSNLPPLVPPDYHGRPSLLESEEVE